jgi:hypothetical protein
MVYTYLAIMAAALALSIFIIINEEEDYEENILEDIPNIYINNEELERHAIQISTHYSETKIRTVEGA